MRNGIGIETKFLHFLAGPTIVGNADRGREQQFGLPLRAISLYGNNDRWAKQNAVFGLLRGNESSLLDSEPLSQLCRNNDRTALADLGGFHDARLYPMPDIQAGLIHRQLRGEAVAPLLGQGELQCDIGLKLGGLTFHSIGLVSPVADGVRGGGRE